MGFTSQQLWECLVNRRSENKQFAQEFNNRKAWGKHYYNLVWEGKTPNLVACYLKTESIVRISVYIVSDEIYKKVNTVIDDIEKDSGIELYYHHAQGRTSEYRCELKNVKDSDDADNLNAIVDWIVDTSIKLKFALEKYYPGAGSLSYTESGDEGIGEYIEMNDNTVFDHNMILYGPPGTGKTYNSAIYAVAICDGKSLDELTDYDEVMARYNELKLQNRIAFTTFHQSYGYEEFIEGIKPVIGGESSDVSYTIEAGAFKRFCEIARTPANVEINPNSAIWFMRLDDDNSKTLKDTCLANSELRIDIAEDDEWSKERFINSMNVGDYVLSYAGSSIYIDAIGLIEGEAVEEERENYRWNRKVKWYVLPEKTDVKAINGNTYLPNFSIAKMNHMKLSDLLRLIPQVNVSEPTKPYVFIVDEINRGNISKIFGELITLIENTKREGMPEATSAILPYSGEIFSVPSNVYILGTMNTADRSIALMDTALRRRFQFVEMMPDADVLRAIGADHVVVGAVELDVATMLETINERISFLYDREHTIGHAFFTGLAQDNSITKLASIFSKSVIPLLQEYFYEDYQKIQLVLGDNGKSDDSHKFIKDIKVVAKNIFNGNVDDVIDLPEKKYEINEDALLNIYSYIEIM